jgi:hypothetical protein
VKASARALARPRLYVSLATAEVIGSIVGVIAVLFCPMLAIKMLLNKDLGEFRFSVVLKQN